MDLGLGRGSPGMALGVASAGPEPLESVWGWYWCEILPWAYDKRYKGLTGD